MALDLSSLKKATVSLQRSIQVINRKLKDEEIDKDEIEVLKAGVIQNFEFTYELCWKFMKRWLALNISEDFTSGLTRKQLFRYSLENKLIEEFDQWVRYHALRNLTSYTYDHGMADEIYKEAEYFLLDAQKFIEALEKRND